MNRLKQEIMAAAAGRITSDEMKSVARSYRFPESFIGFSGHFPGNPILPGIVQLLTVVSLIEEHTGTEQKLLAVEDARFLNPILPDQEILVQCQQRTVRGKLLHEARLTVSDRPAASFLIQLRTVEGIS